MNGRPDAMSAAQVNGTRGNVVFGIVRPCTHRLTDGLKAEWMAHLCGLCLALRADHGQFARIVTNYDGLVVSVLTEAQTERNPAQRRTAGPCPLRAMRTATVARGAGARLAAAVSLVLASAKVRDHVADRDGALARRPVAAVARRIATGWERAGARTGSALGFDTGVLADAVERQAGIESLAAPGTPLTAVTEPTETATAAAFAHTAVLAGRPRNAAPLAEAGRLFGRLAHLLDAVEDREADAASGAWNPLTATGTSLAEARRLADGALHGTRLALREAEFTDDRLLHVLLTHELRRSVDRAFGTASCPHQGRGGHPPRGEAPHGGAYGDPHGGAAGPYGRADAHGDGSPYGGVPGGGSPYGGGTGGYGGEPPRSHVGGKPPKPGPRGFWAGCAAFAGLCCTCRLCCAEEYEGPWSRKKREGCCHKGGRDCGCECCECCCPCDGG
ncbi:DUF5685 family protein [Streptomyces tirandamycinicus]|uniref:DUF5685 family protein n=1 Tax=Streptomyces tirandamycinicus TaxID=2174846 RepID=UPI0022720E82|nr:DUF5685 family protein [Streptomyces tirandamycinicus]MCY0980974.1 DUF5685 family protein [Streptomyces tirandamycinicus]